MANIYKTGVVNSTGITNPNLLSRYVTPGQQSPTSTTSSGRTIFYGDYGIKLKGEAGDTYFRLFMKEQLVQNEQYTISCYASGLLDGSLYNFPLFSQSNGSMGVLPIDHNGLCCFTFTMTYTGAQTAVVVGTGPETVYVCFMDDISRNIISGQGEVTLTNFKLEKGTIPTPWYPYENDPNYVRRSSGLFEIDDICRIRKNGNIQSSEFIEF